MTGKRAILFVYLSLGAFALVSQTILMREFFVIVYGNEFIFAVLLTNWLIGVSSGAISGAFVAEHLKFHISLFVSSILLMLILLPISIFLTRLLYFISNTPIGSHIRFYDVFLFSALFIIPVSFLIGLAFPIAAKVQFLLTPISNPDDKSSKPFNVSGILNIYIFEAIGSLFGGAIYTFFLAGKLNAFFIVSLFSLPLLIAIWFLHPLNKRLKFFTFSLGALFLFALLPDVNGKLESFSVEKRWNSMSSLPLTYSTDSRFQNIVIADLSNQHNLYLNTTFTSSFPNDDDNMILAAHLICQHPAPKRILVIGDAAGGIAKFLLKYNVSDITSVEIDPKSVESIFKFLPIEDKQILADNRFNIVICDGRKFIKDMRRSFDIIYVNVPEPSTLLLNRFYSREFFVDAAKTLGNNGTLALKITSSESYVNGIITDYSASVFNTVKSVFRFVTVTPGVQNYIFASNSPNYVSDNPDILSKRYETSGMSPAKLGMIFQSLYPKDTTNAYKNVLLHRWEKVLNTDDTPISCLFYNKIIGWYSRSNISGILGFFESIKLIDIIFLVAAIFIMRLVFVFFKKNKSKPGRFLGTHILFAVFSSGLAGLSLELVILYIFQSNFGEIYHIVGLIIALFMFGLPLGAASARRAISMISPSTAGDNTRVVRLIIAVQIATGLIAALLPRIINLFLKFSFISQVSIFALTTLIGFLVGFIFPLSIHVFLGNKPHETGKTAGIVDAVDHIGAALGAFFIGTLFLPVFGVQNVCVFIALFPFMSAVLLLCDNR